MKLVVDANILFAAVIRNGLTRQLLYKKLELFAPDHLFVELERYEQLLKEKGLRSEDAHVVTRLLLRRITILRPDKQYISEADTFSPDPNDAPYLALCLQLKAPLWSNDRLLKRQKAVPVLTTQELAAL